MTQAGCAWTITQGNPDVVIAVVDADFDMTNDDLNDGQIISMWGANNGSYFHGSRVAGMIVATPNNGVLTAGLAPNVKVAAYSVPTFQGPTGGWLGNPWPGIWQVYQDGRRIINVSWTGTGFWPVPPVLNETRFAIEEMVANGTLLVVAAGNSQNPPGGSTGHDNYADIPGIVMASSVSSDGSVHQWSSGSYVSYNEHVDLCAPGNGVGNVETGGWGTSYSAPATCAAAGLILSVNDCLSPSEIENILKATACPMLPNPVIQSNWVGAGSLNMYQAVLMAQGRSGTISQNEPAWEGVTYVSSNLTIGSGVTLTINGTVKLSEGASLIIKPGGRVNLYGTLTNSCIGPWDGVVVEGISDESQWTSGKHGRLNTFDGAVIENAVTGVKLVDGGILYGKSTSFKNNGTGVVYNSYSNFWPIPGPQFKQPRNHFGGFSNCTFLANDEFNKAAPLNAGIQMEGVRGIGINGCSFLNERTIKNPMGNDDYGYGIKATDARFVVASLGIGSTFPPTSFDHSLFKGLGYGIYIGTAQPPDDNGTPTQPNDDFVNVPYVVQQATFSECIYGIHNRFVSQGIIVGNTFNMGKLPPAGSLSGNTPFTNEQFGVFIENGANGFELQENQFVKVPDNVEYAYGSYCQKLGWFNNEVRRNTYTNVNYGNLAEDDNAIVFPTRGLNYLCNSNATQRYDFHVFEGGDIRAVQGLEIQSPTGSSFITAGNGFTRANNPDGDFDNNGQAIRYYYTLGAPEEPLFVSSVWFTLGIANECASDYCLPPCREQSELSALKVEYYSEKGLFQTTLDQMQAAMAVGNQALAEGKSTIAAAYRLKLDKLSNLISLHMAFDTISHNLDSVRIWWQNMDSPVSDMVIARDYLAKGQNTMAFTVLGSIPSKYGLSESEQLSDIVDFRSIMQIMQGESAANLPENKVQQLLNFANTGTGISAAWAKNILTVKGYHFPPIPKNPEGYGERDNEQPNKLSYLRGDLYTVAPNPAKDYVEFRFTDPKHIAKSIYITDVTGKAVFSLSDVDEDNSIFNWHTSNMNPGIYFYTIYGEIGRIQSGRIVVVK